MDKRQLAATLAAKGMYLFPLNKSGTPAATGWQDMATQDADTLDKWFYSRGLSVAISTSRFQNDNALIVVDVDVKKGKRGDLALMELELQGLEFPPTFEQTTRSGGRHLIYWNEFACKQGVDVLGVGLDIRSRGGYVVAYEDSDTPIAHAPQWLVERLGRDTERPAQAAVVLEGIDQTRATERAIAYLQSADVAVEGQGGDLTTYKVAAALKDLGCRSDQAYELMLLHWNDRCTPPWDEQDLADKIAHAYRYGKEPVGASAPEAVFHAMPAEPGFTAVEDEPVGHPVRRLNDEFAYIKRGAFILQETTDDKGRFVTEHLSQGELHGWHANVPVQIGKTTKPVSMWWIESPERRQYEGVVFAPQQDRGPRWYNLWRGFSYEPHPGGHPALDMFLEHAMENVCHGDKQLFNWLMGFFAHMIQRPWEKPLVAVAFRGEKGTGKNALVERVGALLGKHFMVADDDRYLLSNFNAHFESCLFIVFDEASWAGDKRAEGKLKGLITGARHNIERKGKEPYEVENLTRVCIIGNEEWIVPASVDERRFAVFNVGEGRKQDRQFFHDMRTGMEQGGYGHLLHYLQSFDLSTVDVNDAPQTEGLVDQKLAGLGMVEQWWFNCINANMLLGADFSEEIPERIATNKLFTAFERHAKKRNIKSRLPEEVSFGRTMHKIAPSFEKRKNGKAGSGDSTYAFFNPGLKKLRSDWEQFIGGKVKWEES